MHYKSKQLQNHINGPLFIESFPMVLRAHNKRDIMLWEISQCNKTNKQPSLIAINVLVWYMSLWYSLGSNFNLGLVRIKVVISLRWGLFFFYSTFYILVTILDCPNNIIPWIHWLRQKGIIRQKGLKFDPNSQYSWLWNSMIRIGVLVTWAQPKIK